MSQEILRALVLLLFGFIEAENMNVIQPFVVNGTDAEIEEFPYLVRRNIHSRPLNWIMKFEIVPLSGLPPAEGLAYVRRMLAEPVVGADGLHPFY